MGIKFLFGENIGTNLKNDCQYIACYDMGRVLASHWKETITSLCGRRLFAKAGRQSSNNVVNDVEDSGHIKWRRQQGRLAIQGQEAGILVECSGRIGYEGRGALRALFPSTSQTLAVSPFRVSRNNLWLWRPRGSAFGPTVSESRRLTSTSPITRDWKAERRSRSLANHAM